MNIQQVIVWIFIGIAVPVMIFGTNYRLYLLYKLWRKKRFDKNFTIVSQQVNKEIE